MNICVTERIYELTEYYLMHNTQEIADLATEDESKRHENKKGLCGWK